jgi:hypothetical protein
VFFFLIFHVAYFCRAYIPADGPTAAILVWFEILTSTGPSWWTNPNVLRLMDALCEAAMYCDADWKVWEVIAGKLVNLQRVSSTCFDQRQAVFYSITLHITNVRVKSYLRSNHLMIVIFGSLDSFVSISRSWKAVCLETWQTKLWKSL